MGVLACDRRGCQNIMCDHYSSEYGYICNECFDELVRLGADTNIEEFMDNKKERYIPITEIAFEKFDREFSDREVY